MKASRSVKGRGRIDVSRDRGILEAALDAMIVIDARLGQRLELHACRADGSEFP
ncbi:MAG: hypothetical protein M3432_00685 [Chloroflexota bacterium]|nr:hypothetical protein [Chloroflexota bacterium]